MYKLGRNISVHLFGSSHGPCVGCIIEGLPKNTIISRHRIAAEMELRRPKDGIGTPRKEKDLVEVAGDVNGKAVGIPIIMTIRNENTHGRSYSQFTDRPRPGHADLPALMRFRNFDIRGGGPFSGRLTAPLVAAGAVMKDLLGSKGIEIAAFTRSVGSVEDPERDIHDMRLTDTRARTPALDEMMKKEILKASEDGDSVGGIIECIVTGLPIGFGGIWFEGLDSEIASSIFSIPAVKGIEFGKGFELSGMRGSESNDPYTIADNKIVAEKNDMGGIVGGMSNGMPMVFRVAFKPTPSISKEQSTVDLKTMTQTTIKAEGRHDPCIVPRAVSVVEAVTAIVIADQAKEAGLFDQ